MSSNESKYSDDKIFIVKCLNIIFMLIWTMIIIFFGLYQTKGFFILWLPYILFGISFFNSDSFTNEVCNTTLQNTFITIGLIMCIPLLTFLEKSDKIKHDIKELLIVAIICILFTYLHVWLPVDDIYIWKHIKSFFETIAVVLFMYVLIMYYLLHH
jgi:hypothetical protein